MLYKVRINTIIKEINLLSGGEKMDIISTLAKEFALKINIVENTVKLIDDGNTIPFIARYRKELTGSMDDQKLRELSERLKYLRGLDEERERIRAVILEQDKLTEELSSKLDAAETMSELQDIYLPFRPKRKTRASVARERGLEPLAILLLEQQSSYDEVKITAESLINDDVTDLGSALSGAMDIIAEEISFDAELRKRLRNVLSTYGTIKSTAINENIDETPYSMYAEFAENASKIANHRILAINRGEDEKQLKVSVDYDNEKAISIIEKLYLKDISGCTEYVKSAIADSYSRLILPAIEREIRNSLTERATDSAINLFKGNLHQLLMQPPLKDRVVLGFDPGYRTGCKLGCVDGMGNLLETSVIYPVPPHNKIEEAKTTVLSLVKNHNVTTFSIGNGTASHETEEFVSSLIAENSLNVDYMVVSEAGASVYSASKAAAAEFPQLDVSLRSAISIARRLQDPLAELVKIDPKALGVGQYQHDMPPAKLNEALDGVIEQCVNLVGVDLNTASAALLSKVAGINSTVAKNIVVYRQENGKFKNRSELKKVSKLGDKAFQQCAGFLRITDGDNPLDNTAVHPESYKIAKGLLLEVGETELNNLTVEQINDYAIRNDVGIPTLKDIISELQKPGRDPRDELPKPMLKKELLSIESLKDGMVLKGTVRNIMDFGAFVDIGVHEDGLVHISQMSTKFIKHPTEVVKVGDIVDVKVIGVDIAKKRIGLSMKQIDC